LHLFAHIINYRLSVIIVLTLLSLCSHTLRKNQFLFTLWEDFGEIEGHEIASKMATEADLIVILGRSIGISTYQGTYAVSFLPTLFYVITKQYTTYVLYRAVTAD